VDHRRTAAVFATTIASTAARGQSGVSAGAPLNDRTTAQMGQPKIESWWARPTDNSATLLSAMIAAFVLLLPVVIAWRQLRLSQRTLEAALAQSQSDAEVRAAEAKSRRAAEFQQRLDQFFSTGTQAAIAIIHHHDRDVRLSEDREVERVTWAECELALVPATHRPYIYEPKLTAIRDCFSELVESLSRLWYFREQELLEAADVQHIAQPLLARLVEHDTPFFRNLRIFIHYCAAEPVLNLFADYVCDIRPSFPDDLSKLEAAIMRGDYGAFQASPWGPAEFRTSASRLMERLQTSQPDAQLESS